MHDFARDHVLTSHSMMRRGFLGMGQLLLGAGLFSVLLTVLMDLDAV
jgi:hypothetical protein